MASEQSIDLKAWTGVWILSPCAARLPPRAWATQPQEAHVSSPSGPSTPESWGAAGPSGPADVAGRGWAEARQAL